jgi:hypothetical protein
MLAPGASFSRARYTLMDCMRHAVAIWQSAKCETLWAKLQTVAGQQPKEVTRPRQAVIRFRITMLGMFPDQQQLRACENGTCGGNCLRP